VHGPQNAVVREHHERNAMRGRFQQLRCRNLPARRDLLGQLQFVAGLSTISTMSCSRAPPP